MRRTIIWTLIVLGTPFGYIAAGAMGIISSDDLFRSAIYGTFAFMEGIAMAYLVEWRLSSERKLIS